MFFLTLLLSEVVAGHVRRRHASLRAIVYSTSCFGFLPPLPSRRPSVNCSHLLKQAGLRSRLVLSTQNPVDLDYKALQRGYLSLDVCKPRETRQAHAEGLKSSTFYRPHRNCRHDCRVTQRTFRHAQRPLFSLHVAPDAWVMSYLAGPLSREQYNGLSATRFPEVSHRHSVQREGTPTTTRQGGGSGAGDRPILPPHVSQLFNQSQRPTAKFATSPCY